MGFVENIKLKAYSRASRYIYHSTLVEGYLRGSDEPFRCLFVDNSSLINYMTSKGFLERVRVLKKRRILLPLLQDSIEGSRNRVDLCVAVLEEGCNYDDREGHIFKTPEFVKQVLDVSSPWEKMKKTFHKSKEAARLIRKHGLSYRISRDPDDFSLFYHRIYLPHLVKQHGPHAAIDPFDDMLSYFQKGFLLIVQHEGRPVSGGLCLIQDRALIFRRTGVLDADEAYIRKGGQSAVYYFMIQYAREKGLKSVDFMNSRPFFKDGVYGHKAEWGAAVQAEGNPSASIHFIVPELTKKAALFFANNPVIVQAPRGLAGLIGWNGGAELSPDEINELRKRYYAPGLESMLLMRSGGEIVPINLSC